MVAAIGLLDGPFVIGRGPRPAGIMLLFDSPGKQESSRNLPVAGLSAAELDRFFDGYHIPARTDCYTTNLVKVRPPDKKEVTPENIAAYTPYLLDELAKVKPQVIVAFGRHSAHWLLGSDRHSLDTLHGVAHGVGATSLAAKVCPDAIVMPAMHPASGISSPERYARFCQDMQRLALLCDARLPEQPLDDGVGDYRVLTGRAEVEAVLKGYRS